jgi:hypothetical protein
MNEREFLLKLQERAKEQEKLMHHMPFPQIFTLIIEWFGNHPWRILIPFAFILSLVFHSIFGQRYVSLVLRIFGGL